MSEKDHLDVCLRLRIKLKEAYEEKKKEMGKDLPRGMALTDSAVMRNILLEYFDIPLEDAVLS